MLQPTRYYVMYDHSNFDVTVRTDSMVYNTVTWVVASYSDLDEAMDVAQAIRSGDFDLFQKPGPWHTLTDLYNQLDKELVF